MRLKELDGERWKWFFFFLGALSTLAYRAIIVLNFYSPQWVKILWYFGTLGFVLYFSHKFLIERRERKAISKYHLLSAIKRSRMPKDKKKALDYVVRTTVSSKWMWNSLIIFILSLVALILGALLDLGWISFN